MTNIGIEQDLGVEPTNTIGCSAALQLESNTTMKLSKLNYKKVLKEEPTFISLDISVRGTGWVKSVKGVITEGRYTIEAKDNLYRRNEFREFLVDLAGDIEYPIIAVEQAIMGNNFKTTEILIQLNTIIDDLVYYGKVKANRIVRIGNKEWKRYLRELTGYTPKILKEDDKVTVRGCLEVIGYKIKETKTKKEAEENQDIHDAYGIILGVIYNERLRGTPMAIRGLKTDVNRGYIVRQYKSLRALKKAGEGEIRRNKAKIKNIDLKGSTRDLSYRFREEVEETQDDSKVYLIEVDTLKMGILALEKKLDTSEEISYLLVKKRNV